MAMIYYVTWGNHLMASSRVRVFNIAPFLKGVFLGTPDELPVYDIQNGNNQYTKHDTLIIQKKPDINELRKAKDYGARVIYDIDDLYWDKAEYRRMIDEADWITVDTDEKKRLLGKDNVSVIPDSLDWDGTKKETRGGGNIIGWTGYGNNAAFLNDVDIPNGYTLRIIAPGDWCHHYQGYAQGRPWSIAMVDKYLAECDFGMYYLPDREAEQSKGMHKLIKNWAIGIPTYTSPMPDYVKAMEEAGVGRKYIVEKKEDWKTLTMEYNAEDMRKCFEYSQRYTPDKISKLWEKVILGE